MEDVLEILRRINPDVDYESEEALFDDGLLNSLDLMGLVSELEDHFDVEIGMDDMIPENFNSAAAIHELIVRLQG